MQKILVCNEKRVRKICGDNFLLFEHKQFALSLQERRLRPHIGRSCQVERMTALSPMRTGKPTIYLVFRAALCLEMLSTST